MEVNADNFQEALQDIQNHLEGASFVAIDLELTGVSVGDELDSYADLAAERLEKSCRIAEGYAIIQLGVTICGRGRNRGSHALNFATYSILVAPEETFVCETSALKFVRKFGGDLNAWVDSGVRYTNARAGFTRRGGLDGVDQAALIQLQAASKETGFICHASRFRADRRKGFDLNAWVDSTDEMAHEDATRFLHGDAQEEPPQRRGLECLWQALRKAGRPLVVHGHLDVLFLLAALEQRPLPRKHQELAKLIMECFPSGVFDTSYLHEAIGEFRRWPLRLQDFHRKMSSLYMQKFPNDRLELSEETMARYAFKGDRNNQHEAGYDSLLTGILFFQMLKLYPKEIEESTNRLFFYRSIECLDFKKAVRGDGVGSSLFDEQRNTLLVIKVTDPKAHQRTVESFSEAIRVDPNLLYRKMDELHFLVVLRETGNQAIEKAKVLSRKLPGVVWLSFEHWQRQARADSGRTSISDGGAARLSTSGPCVAASQPRAQLRAPTAASAPAAQGTGPGPSNNAVGVAVEGGRRFRGVVRRFMGEKGYGFITCPEAASVFGSPDVFVHWRQLGTAQVGQVVTFSVAMNKEGRPQAQELEFSQIVDAQNAAVSGCGYPSGVVGNAACLATGASSGVASGSNSGVASGADGPGGGAHGRRRGDTMRVPPKLLAPVSSSSSSSACAGGGSQVPGRGPSQGQSASSFSASRGVPGGFEDLMGRVKSFKESKAYGFIEPFLWPANAPNVPSKDVFVHNVHLLGRSSLEPGECVMFNLVFDDNKPQARFVRVIQPPLLSPPAPLLQQQQQQHQRHLIQQMQALKLQQILQQRATASSNASTRGAKQLADGSHTASYDKVASSFPNGQGRASASLCAASTGDSMATGSVGHSDDGSFGGEPVYQ